VDESTTYLLVDGENIDVTLGTKILGRKPKPDERPRWARLVSFAEQEWGAPVRGLFYMNASENLPLPFIQALDAMHFRTVPLSGTADQKVVDIAIQRTLESIANRPDADVILVSHDGDFIDWITPLLGGERRVGLMGFDEFCNAGYRGLDGLEFFDLERDVEAFTSRLPRLRVIPIDEFDPLEFL
jgi:uncharacterized protein